MVLDLEPDRLNAALLEIHTERLPRLLAAQDGHRDLQAGLLLGLQPIAERHFVQGQGVETGAGR